MKSLFKRNSLLGFRTTLLVFLALALMVFDRQGIYLSKARAYMTMAVLPFQALIDKPVYFYRWLENTVSAQQEVLTENASLRVRQLLLQAKLQRLLAIERENLHLRALLHSSSHLTGDVIVAQLSSVDIDPLTREVMLDKGERERVFVGQPVLSALLVAEYC
jgi:rod shape-determining protein MreC